MTPIHSDEGPHGLAAIDTYQSDKYAKPFYIDRSDDKANLSWISRGYPVWIVVRDQRDSMVGDAVCKAGERKDAEQFMLDLCNAAVP